LEVVPLKIQIEEEHCIGCHLCETYCIAEHSRSKDLIKAFKKEYPRPLARVHVEEAKPVSFALLCRHCEDPLCVYACLTGAMSKDRNGLVQHNPERCMGCWSCIMVCPFGAIARDERVKKSVSKCDLCSGRKKPSCVEHCPNGALVCVEA